MHKHKLSENSTSTPKRRRLGYSRVSRNQSWCLQHKMETVPEEIMSPILNHRLKGQETPERCETPLPCNQAEYLNSSNTDPSLSQSDVIEYSGEISNKFFDNTFESKTLKSQVKTNETRCNLEDYEDMFNSEIEIDSSTVNNINNTLRLDLNESLLKINQTMNVLENVDNLFETKDSFLLDVKEPLIDEIKKNDIYKENTFYGLPMMVKSLFKTYRNIEKLFDWQEECLNLDTVKQRRNLIYSLPTSGGKTLVAEILMLREVLCRKKNALLILPFVAIVQEKIWALSTFALQLGFLVEEYAAGKGHIPPKKRRKKNSIYIATIEKGLALVRSLIELGRLDEIGIIVVDELHLIGEGERGSTLEMLLSTVIFANKGIQIVGMSATIGNLGEIAQFLRADVFQREFRPVELTEYVKLGNMLHKLQWKEGQLDVVPEREVKFDYSASALTLDPDYIGGLVSEATPCLVFCPTKRNCENVASLLASIQKRQSSGECTKQRELLEQALRNEGANSELCRCVRHGVAYHHAGLANDERVAIENAFRAGVIFALCCTSTLAAGVNVPARRVIIRAPRVARAFMALAQYRQMVGRAGRTGHQDTGDSILICPPSDWQSVSAMLRGGVNGAMSHMGSRVSSLILSGLAAGMCKNGDTVEALVRSTLLHVQREQLNIDTKQLACSAIHSLVRNGFIEISTADGSDAIQMVDDQPYLTSGAEIKVSTFGTAVIKGCLELSQARLLQQDLELAAKSLVLQGSCHLLYLLTPHDITNIVVDYRHYYKLYCDLNEDCVQTAKVLGITEKNAIRMMMGKQILVSETVLKRFYLALVLYDLWHQVPFANVAEKYAISRGYIQSLMCSAASLASMAARFCGQIERYWPFAAIFAELAPRLQHCAAPEITALMDLPNVKKARALQLFRAGYKRVEDLAKASPEELTGVVSHLSHTAATHLVSAAKMALIEKVENLRAEAEEVMEGLDLPT